MVRQEWFRDVRGMSGLVWRRRAGSTPALAAVSRGRTTARGPRRLAACLALVACWGMVPQGHADVIRAASCALADVQRAVNTATTGGTVRLPPCTHDEWPGTVTINKPIILEGHGTAETVIQRSAVSANFATNPMFQVDDVTGFEMRNMTLDGTHDTHPNEWRDTALYLRNCVDFRIHHMAFTDFAQGILVSGNPEVMQGLIDHNTFTDMWWKVPPQSLGYGVHVAGSGSLSYPALSLGTAQNVFIEDNTFTRTRHTVASNNAARYVFRYNTIIDQREDAGAIDAHGFTGSWSQGTRQYEVYNNSITNSVTRFCGVCPRGGDGVIFNNVMSPMSSNRDILLLNDSGCSESYPKEDQIRELHIWGNTRHGGAAAQVKVKSDCEEYIKEDRDYFLRPRPNYTPYPYPHPLQGPPPSDLTSHLRLHLKFDEGMEATAQDSTVHRHDGTLSAGVTWGAGKLGPHAVQLDGTPQGVVTVAGELTTPAAVTLAAWVNPAAFPSATGDIISIGDAVMLRMSSTHIRGTYYTGTTWTSIRLPVSLATMTWHHLAYTVQAGTQRLYLNGVQVTTGDTEAAPVYTALGSQTVLGGHGNGNPDYRFQGAIDDVRVYTRALSAVEIAGLAAYTEAEPPPGPRISATPAASSSPSPPSPTILD